MSAPGQGRGRARATAPHDGMLTQLVRARRIGPRAVDAVRMDIERDSRLGVGYLGIGAVIVGVIMLGRGIIALGWLWPATGIRPFSVLGWMLVLAAFAAAVLLSRRNRGMLPRWAFAALLVVDAGALALDYAALASAGAPADQLTVGIGVGATLLACVTFRPMANIVIATIGLTALSLAALVAYTLLQPGGPAVGVSQLALTVVPVFAGIAVVRAFGQLVQRELDRTVAESTISAPRYGLGILASSELARLDLAAEELLQDVAGGRAALPLDRELATTASTLATDLRRMLVAGRRETWLHHAISESEYLAPAVTLNDPDGLAGYLDPPKRDGLLSAIWLVIDESGRSSPTIELTIGRPDTTSRPAPDDSMVLPIAISVGGITRRRIDPAVWSALARVGPYSVDARTGRLRVRVDAHVVVPDASR